MLLFFIFSIIGIALSFIHASFASLFTFLFLGIIFLLCSKKYSDSAERQIYMFLAIILIGLSLGQARVMLISYPDISPSTSFVEKKITIRGVVGREPVSDGKFQNVLVRTRELVLASTTQPFITGVLVKTPAFPEFRYGDVVEARGTLRIPMSIENEDGRTFDYQMYLFKDSVTHTLSSASVKMVGEEGNPVLKFLFGIKRHFLSSIRSVIPEPEAGLLAGILLGTDTLQKSIKDEFRVAGLSHIIVLSGYNITIVAESLLKMVSLVSMRFAFGFSFVGVILFVLMAGAGASAVRAGVMASIALIGRSFGKTYNASRALFLAVWGMSMWNPFIVLYDPSFHLSVIATYGIMYVTPIVEIFMEKYASFLTKRFGLRELSATTLGAQLSVLPYILYMSGNFGIYAFPANFLVLPFVPLTMLLGFLTALFGFVSRFVGLIPGIPTYALLWWDLFIARLVSKLPYANIHIPYIPLSLLIIFYIIFGFFVYRFHKRQTEKQNQKQSIEQKPSDTIAVRSGDESIVSY